MEEARKKLEKLISENFNSGDVLITLKYKRLGKTEKSAEEARAFAARLAREYRKAGKEPAYIMANTEKCSRIVISGWEDSKELTATVRKLWKRSKVEKVTDIKVVAGYMAKDFTHKYLISNEIRKREAGATTPAKG